MLAGPNHSNIYAVSVNPSLDTNTVLQPASVSASGSNVISPQIIQGPSTSQRQQGITQSNQVVSVAQPNQIISLTPVRSTYAEYQTTVKYHQCS